METHKFGMGISLDFMMAYDLVRRITCADRGMATQWKYGVFHGTAHGSMLSLTVPVGQQLKSWEVQQAEKLGDPRIAKALSSSRPPQLRPRAPKRQRFQFTRRVGLSDPRAEGDTDSGAEVPLDHVIVGPSGKQNAHKAS